MLMTANHKFDRTLHGFFMCSRVNLPITQVLDRPHFRAVQGACPYELLMKYLLSFYDCSDAMENE